MAQAASAPTAGPQSALPTVADSRPPATVPTYGAEREPADAASGHASVTPRSTTAAPVSTQPVSTPSGTSAPVTTRAAAPVTTHATPTPTAAARPVQRPTVRVFAKRPAAAAGQRLPVHYSTGTATKVITVEARSTRRTTATLQAWTKVAGGWRKHGSAVTAHIGADGMSTHPSESRSATPMGSFTLTQAFGHDSDPGTALPYLHTNRNDWWISQPGRLYNTHQRCASHCAFTRGDPNEHLYYETPYYNYGVVIDYNTHNAPGGVHQGRGSAFFLHVTDGHPTAGCVAVPQSKVVSLLRWLNPGAHPRILIGT
jgi:L,D-peptidoglycan transpeptidase YkuD (ErfK/YbiS/YcfS/YnhG family)